jgi:CheY-like chemotaxis protein
MPFLEPVALSILLVDNDPDTLDCFSIYLRMSGVTVRTATGGRAALRLAALVRPDVIVLDIAMPDMDGFEVVNGLKQDPETAAIPVVLFTGTVLRKDVKRRAEVCVSKPCRPADLLRVVQEVGTA